MEHHEAQSLFSDYLEGEIPPERRMALEEHLTHCPICDKEWQAFGKTVSEVSGLLSLSPPSDVVTAVERKIARRSRGRFFAQPQGNRIQFAFVSFLLVLCFLLAYLLLTAFQEMTLIDDAATSETDVDTPRGSSMNIALPEKKGD